MQRIASVTERLSTEINVKQKNFKKRDISYKSGTAGHYMKKKNGTNGNPNLVKSELVRGLDCEGTLIGI
jgi:hypothetical protein